MEAFARNVLSIYIIRELLPEGSENELKSAGFSPLGYNEWTWEHTSKPNALFRTTCITTVDKKDVILTVEECEGEDIVYTVSDVALELMARLNVPSITKAAYLYALENQQYGEAHYEVEAPELLAQMRKGPAFAAAALAIAEKFGITTWQAEDALVEHQLHWNE